MEMLSLWTEFYVNSRQDCAEYHEFNQMPSVGDIIKTGGPYGVKQQHRVERLENEIVFASGKVVKLKRPHVVLKRVFK